MDGVVEVDVGGEMVCRKNEQKWAISQAILVGKRERGLSVGV